MAFTCALDLDDEFVHEAQVVRVLLPEVLFTHLSGELLSIFCSEGHEK